MSANTKFVEIYDLFLAQIDDYEIALVDEEESEYVLSRYLKNALPHIFSLNIDVNNINFELNEFNNELNYVQKAIVAKAMTLEWVRTRLRRAELMERDIGDRDYTAIQGTGYLKELNIIEERLNGEIRQMVIDYSYQKGLF